MKVDTIILSNCESYSIAHNKKSREYILCGTMSNDGIDKSEMGKLFGKFVCRACVEKTANLYREKGIGAGFLWYLKCRVRRAIKDKEEIVVAKPVERKVIKHKRQDVLKSKKFRTRCKLCGKIIDGSVWKEHLKKCHDIRGHVRIKDFYVKPTGYISSTMKWYLPNLPIENNIPCGTKINGGPTARIIYSPTFSCKKKF